ncbi:hypothetical protein AMVITR13b [Betaentomopoxvirus amoorei]|uniref:AMVITR13 n=1 Tax=Amsacta moorei entomopoxvirus TaxID=28321 RepID=Q9DGZ3_AMEPV|nr:hypothetical protein AMVITR13a [Amsacta moorei entomopoxvirus]NP_065049.1 hypothetical protein AMVITR13b [Amsacta moorei entomopoxvirus]AAG02985.1 AMVITR13 [Amsacta moorei entomopoxvirus]AAG02992.1 AMVITR13 [Amsacta moorei entomopoxvirus]
MYGDEKGTQMYENIHKYDNEYILFYYTKDEFKHIKSDKIDDNFNDVFKNILTNIINYIKNTDFY